MRWAQGRYGLLTLLALLAASLLSLAVAVYAIHLERGYAREDAQRLDETIREKAAEINRQRSLTSEEFAVATRALRDLALLAQNSPGNDPTLVAFKGEVLRRVHERTQRMASYADQAGGTDLATANDRLSLADLFLALGRPDEAEQQYQRAVQITRAVDEAQPDSLAAKNGLWQSARGLAHVQLALRQPANARQSARTAAAAAEERTKADPKNPVLKRDLAGCYNAIADASIALHDWPAARAALDQMVATIETYANTDPKNPGRMDLAHTCITRGQVERLDHDYEQAVRWYDRAFAIMRPLKAEGKLLPPDVAHLAETEKTAADCRDILKAINDIDFALKERGGETTLHLLAGRAAALARRGRPAEAEATAEKMRELKPQDGGNLYNVARTYALCVPAVGAGKPADALTAEEKEARAGYAARAVKELRAAADQGFRNVEHIEADPDLDALHADAGYRAFVAELKALRFWVTFPVLP